MLKILDKYILLILLSLPMVNICFCQNADLGLKIRRLQEIRDEKERVNILLEISSSYLKVQPDSTIKYIKQALTLAFLMNDQNIIGKAYEVLGDANFNKNQFNEALKNYKSSLHHFQQVNNFINLGSVYYNAGKCQYNLGDYKESEKYFFRAHELAFSAKQDTLYAKSSLWIGISLSARGEIKESMKYHFEALNLADKLNLKSVAASATLEIGIAYSTMRNPVKALEHYNMAANLYRQANDKINLCITLSNISNEYISLSDYKNAIKHTTEALKIAEQINDKIEIGSQQSDLCRLYTHMKQYKKAFEYGFMAIRNFQAVDEKVRLIAVLINIGELYSRLNKFSEAIIYFTQSLNLAKEFQVLEAVRSCYSYLSSAYEAKEDYKQSLIYSKLFNSISDSIYNKENSRQILDMQTKYESDKKEKENELLRIDKELQQQIISKQYTFIILGGLGLLLLGIATTVFLRLNIQKKKMNLLLKNQKEQLELTSARLEELNNTKDKFLSIIAHDLKNPFHGLMGITRLLIESPKLTEDKRNQYYDVMLQTLETSSTLLDNLLQWAKSQTGLIDPVPESILLSDLVKKNLTLYEGLLNEKRINVVIELKENQNIFADKNMLDTVIRNIISNAVKYTPDEGKIIISAINEEGKIKISIKDSGVGMSHENIKHLFKIDKVFSTRGTRDEKGSGLGLLVCKEFIELHKGKIYLESEPGSGSTFYLVLPANRK